MTLSGADVRRLLTDHDLRPHRGLGQNFVIDPNTVRRIARIAEVGEGASVVEIGAGLGSLTLALAETGAQVTALEVDRRLVPVLREVVAGLPVRVVEADALHCDWSQVLGPATVGDPAEPSGPATVGDPAEPSGPARGWALVANLPYNVATPVVLTVLEQAPQVRSLVVMVQREVAERMAAAPGDAAYGAASVRIAYWATAAVVGRVPPTVFYPKPRVESALVRMVRRDEPAVSPSLVSYDRLSVVVRAGFGQRRKMLRRSLAGTVPPGAFVAADVAPEARAEDLSVEQWGRLAAVGPA